MTYHVSRRSLLALGAGLGASAALGGNALAKAPKIGTQPSYFYRFNLGSAEVTVVSDGPLPLGPPKGTFVGVPGLSKTIGTCCSRLQCVQVTSPITANCFANR